MQLKRSLLVSIVFFILLSGCSKPPEGVTIGDTAPDFSLADHKGKRLSLSDQKGKVILLRFWADWCPNCKEEMPLVDALYRDRKDKGFVVMGVNVKQGEEAVSSFVEIYKITFPTPLDKEAAIARSYGVIGLPTTFIIDRDGKVREKVMGDMTREDMEKLVSPLL